MLLLSLGKNWKPGANLKPEDSRDTQTPQIYTSITDLVLHTLYAGILTPKTESKPFDSVVEMDILRFDQRGVALHITT